MHTRRRLRGGRKRGKILYMHKPGESEKGARAVGLAIAYSFITCSSRKDLPIGDASPMPGQHPGITRPPTVYRGGSH